MVYDKEAYGNQKWGLNTVSLTLKHTNEDLSVFRMVLFVYSYNRDRNTCMDLKPFPFLIVVKNPAPKPNFSKFTSLIVIRKLKDSNAKLQA